VLLKTRGIVLRTVKYGETSVITDLFTEEKGVHTFIGGSVRTARSRMPFSLFQPMSVIDIVAYYREGEGIMHRLKEARAAEIFTRIPFDVRHGAVAMFMAEICRKCLHESDENRDLFEFVLQYLFWLDRTETPIANIHLHFLLHLSGHLGFQPVAEDAEGEMFFDLKEGVFEAVPPVHGQYMGVEQTRDVLQLLEMPLEMCHEVPMTRAARKELLRHLLQFYQRHIPAFGEVHTPEVLEMVF
jgi:DNA repair protein RecO (recombination protein O)